MSTAVPFTIILPTVYGQMLVNRHDINQTQSLWRTGRGGDHASIEQLAALARGLPTAPVCLDIGANFGTYTLALAAIAGRVLAFEPQRILFNMLAGSVALNALRNVWCFNAALGAAPGRIEIPQFDYDQEMNFGSIEFGPEQREPLPQHRGHDPDRAEYVDLITVDGLDLPRVDLMKIDVEGMEPAVLAGAAETIRRDRPVLFVEWWKNDQAALAASIEQLDYAVHPRGANLLCVPAERRDSVPVTPADQWSIH